MSNKLAIFFGFVILALLAWDFLSHDMAGTTFLARKIVVLIEWLAFWR